LTTEEKTLIFICQNTDCKSRGGEEIMVRLQEAFADNEGLEVCPYMCFGTCHNAPNIVIYPERQWYSDVRVSDVPEIVEALQQGSRVERICDQIDEGARNLIYTLLDAGIY